MKKKLFGAGMAGVLATAVVMAASAGASVGPANTLDGCAVGPGQGSSCTWTADVQGSYAGVTDTGWTVSEQTCTIDATTGAQVLGWKTLASGGAGPFASTPGVLQPGKDGCGNAEVYQLTVAGNGGGALGSVTGQPGAA
jgi:hypothetical protein